MGGFDSGPGSGRRPGAKRSYDYDVDAEEVPDEPDFDHRLPPANE
jgi:hypothetical protein